MLTERNTAVRPTGFSEPSDGVAAGFPSLAPTMGVAASRPGRQRPTGRHEPRSRKEATQSDMAIAQAIAPLDGVPGDCTGFAPTETAPAFVLRAESWARSGVTPSCPNACSSIRPTRRRPG